MSKLIGILTASGVPVTVLAFAGGGVLDGSFSREIKISSDSSNGDKQYISFFKDFNGSSDHDSGLFIKTTLKTERFGGVGSELKGALGIKLSSVTDQTKEESKPWVMIGSAEGGMFYIPGWRVTDWTGAARKINRQYKTWKDWFMGTTFTKNEDSVGPDVWCDKAFEKYKGFLTGPLKIVIQKEKPIFAGNTNGGEIKIFANKNSGTSSVNFGKTGCDYAQGFAWLGSQAVIVGNWEKGTKDATKNVSRTFKGLTNWGIDAVKGVNLGELNGLILDRIDRISITSEGIKDSRGHFIKWNPKYNPTIKIN
ncbi:hypothetical protein OVS_01575 [Mycoplasma ovis str. Michigan]|uniref:Uncharacterized protein n=1 Tax=Mycoplasma ovis str. Michigan TaxID=1415773 RepID=A0ABM5P169_9MOLU|nr:hypothetical protein [Mycoplasma ovis]AHC40217.1 hypothetical protein OVS_01575 [Mycoplasma ovis str. Michigan]